MMLQLYNANKAIANRKTAKLPASYYKAHQVAVKQEYKPSVLHQTLLLFLHAKASLFIQPGQTLPVTFTLDKRSLAFWDAAAHSWLAEAGEFEVMLGRSSAHILLSATFQLTDTLHFDGPGRASASLTLQSTVKDLLADDAARALLDAHIPGFSSNPQLGFASGLSLEQVSGFDPSTFNEQTMQAIELGLKNLNARA